MNAGSMRDDVAKWTNWINQHTNYTHGYGFVAAQADTETEKEDRHHPAQVAQHQIVQRVEGREGEGEVLRNHPDVEDVVLNLDGFYNRVVGKLWQDAWTSHQIRDVVLERCITEEVDVRGSFDRSPVGTVGEVIQVDSRRVVRRAQVRPGLGWNRPTRCSRNDRWVLEGVFDRWIV